MELPILKTQKNLRPQLFRQVIAFFIKEAKLPDVVFTYYSELKVESQYSMGQSLFSRPWKFSSCPAILTD